jgi:hypothetical protein
MTGRPPHSSCITWQAQIRHVLHCEWRMIKSYMTREIDHVIHDKTWWRFVTNYMMSWRSSRSTWRSRQQPRWQIATGEASNKQNWPLGGSFPSIWESVDAKLALAVVVCSVIKPSDGFGAMAVELVGGGWGFDMAVWHKRRYNCDNQKEYDGKTKGGEFLVSRSGW